MKNCAIILAGGRGSRMKRSKNKTLETLCGKPIICHIADVLQKQNLKIFVVVSPNSEIIKKLPNCEFVVQNEPLGTGDALRCACAKIGDNFENILVVNGDGPVFDENLLIKMLDMNNCAVNLLIKNITEQNTFGKIERDKKGNICNIIETKDCTLEQLTITEINMGIYCFNSKFLMHNISKLSKNNAQNEYYATDLINLIYKDGGKIQGVDADNFEIFSGVNTLDELVVAENKMQKSIIQKLQNNGVRIIGQSYFEFGCVIAKDTTIFPFCYIDKNSYIGENTKIGVNNLIFNSNIGDNAILGANCYLLNCKIGANCKFGSNITLENCVIGDNVTVLSNSQLINAEILANHTVANGVCFQNIKNK